MEVMKQKIPATTLQPEWSPEMAMVNSNMKKNLQKVKTNNGMVDLKVDMKRKKSNTVQPDRNKVKAEVYSDVVEYAETTPKMSEAAAP